MSASELHMAALRLWRALADKQSDYELHERQLRRAWVNEMGLRAERDRLRAALEKLGRLLEATPTFPGRGTLIGVAEAALSPTNPESEERENAEVSPKRAMGSGVLAAAVRSPANAEREPAGVLPVVVGDSDRELAVGTVSQAVEAPVTAGATPCEGAQWIWSPFERLSFCSKCRLWSPSHGTGQQPRPQPPRGEGVPRCPTCDSAGKGGARLCSDGWHERPEPGTVPVTSIGTRIDPPHQPAAPEQAGMLDELGNVVVAPAVWDELQSQLTSTKAELEQCRVQLAGCGAAALGYADDCKPGDYGYSASLGDVLQLRRRTEAAEARAAELEVERDCARADLADETERCQEEQRGRLHLQELIDRAREILK